MNAAELVIASRSGLGSPAPTVRKEEAEGGCGVIGIASSVPIAGKHLFQALVQMRNRGNGKGGGAALVGLEPAAFGVTPAIVRDDYLLAVAYIDRAARAEVERAHVEPYLEVDHVHEFPLAEVPGFAVKPPLAVAYFVRVKPEARQAFAAEKGLLALSRGAIEDELVYQNTYRLNKAFYASLGEKRAFVLSHGKDMLVLKMVGYAEDVIAVYRLEEVRAHIWIGHHRYPTKGRVWHPGGAHPFMGMHEALVHNGDFANYASVCSYLAQRNIHPLFLTDTEVSVLVFDLLGRTYGYPLEYVIEALAPTTERDFTLLPREKQEVYRQIQATHIHGSPDGPWFFLVAQSLAADGAPRSARLIGITDTSMLRPQVFALQQGAPGEPSIGFAASEKQAIDAALESLAAEDKRFWGRPDRIWNARGGSHTDGGAFVFDVRRDSDGRSELVCTDKFGKRIEAGEKAKPYRGTGKAAEGSPVAVAADAAGLFEEVARGIHAWTYEQAQGFLAEMVKRLDDDGSRRQALETLTLLIDRRYPTGNLRRSCFVSMCDEALARVFAAIAAAPSEAYTFHAHGRPRPKAASALQTVAIDARGFPPEGPGSLALEVNALVASGFQRVVVAHCRGHRFLGNGLGPGSEKVRIEVYGSSGDYLASGIDGAEMVVHGNAQDQLAQIMKGGRLVVHGDVGQTFGYAAKGGEAYILGNAAGRPLINAVGRPRVVINGTCLDYLAESFMAGDPLAGGGFVIVNGVAFAPDGRLVEMETPYPGGNLFSLASGGAIFLRDPRRRVGDDQLNGGDFTAFTQEHWARMLPLLKENERLFGIRVERLLEVDGKAQQPERVYRAIIPAGHHALQPEEAWVSHGG